METKDTEEKLKDAYEELELKKQQILNLEKALENKKEECALHIENLKREKAKLLIFENRLSLCKSLIEFV